jgi:ubiquinone/menaquinone biosynthesis C-methylase UbiE
MTKIDPSSAFASAALPPSPSVAFWNETLAPKFIAYRHILAGGLSRHSTQVFPHLTLHNGDRVLDVGCGFGDTAIELARRVGATGRVTGVDCCSEFLEIAREDQVRTGASNLDFEVADAEIGLGKGPYDVVFARFGTMFFANPVQGLGNMRRTLRPGGRLTHIVWRARDENPWLTAAQEVLLEHLPQPDTSAPSCGPGPFSMADPQTVRAQMEAAGLSDIAFRQIDAEVLVGRTLDEAVAFQLALGPAGEIFRAAGEEAEQKRERIETALRDMFRLHTRETGEVWMDSSSWMIGATAPDPSRD